ncbi:MAG TPA: ABC transporter substrate-binding protein [Anaerolineaceae bacterium]|nr:ABC transporter substrate-binding protein [Anaerolineaceae bacterium]
MKKLPLARLVPTILLLITLFLAGCNQTAPATTIDPSTTLPPPQASATPQATPTAAPQVINICTAEDPGNLYLYSGSDTPSQRSILSVLNDGRFESVLSDNSSGLLTDYPQLGNMVSQIPVTVSAGAVVVDAFGDVSVLQKGSRVRPSQCSAADCVITWDGSSELKMDQTIVKFKLNSDEKWSDGSPLTSADYLFSYQVMQKAGQPANQKLLELTQAFNAIDDYTVEWRALPGFGGVGLEQFLPLPMPAHQLAHQTADSLAESSFYRENFLSWGPYQVKQWEEGLSLTLEANPNYHRHSEGLPKIKDLNFRFISDQNEALRLLQSGDCDVMDSSYNLLSMQTADWQPYLDSLDFHLGFDGQAVEMIFGIRPSVYEGDYQAAVLERPDWFGDPRTREAISLAITKAQLNQVVYGLHLPETVKMPPAGIFGPQVNLETLLDEAGWKLTGASRVAQGVAGVQDGTAFKVTLLTSQSQAHQEIGAQIVNTLASLGIEVSIQALPLEQLYAPGPNGPLFGRNFEMALVSWQSNPVNRCATYMSKAIPSASNHWIGTNLAGLNDEAFDLACSANLVSFEPVSSSNAGAHCEGICQLYLQQSPSVVTIDHVNLWVSNKSLQIESDWTLDQIEWISKAPGN